MPQVKIAIHREAIAAFCDRNHITRLALFGSVLRDDFASDSDVDMLVEFEPEAVITLFDMAAMEAELTAIIGHKVDFRTPKDLSRYFRPQVLEMAQTIYERV